MCILRIGQLVAPEAIYRSLCQLVVTKLFAGPGNWINWQILTSLKRLGFT